jgi:hypothetical protein
MGQFYLTAEHIMKVIGEAQWPSRIGETRQALGWMLTEVIPGPHTANLAKRLRAHLEARVAHWESKAIETRSTPQPPQIQADTQVSEQYSSEAPTTKAIDAGQPASLEGTEDHATVGSPKLDSSRINKWIDDQGYDNETLAQQLKASRRATSSMRNNGKHHGRKLVTKLANLMDCDPEDLYRRSDGV